MAGKYKVKPAAALQSESSRVESILLTPTRWRLEWTPAALKAGLAAIGLDYTDTEITAIIADLVSRNVIEEI